MPERSLNNRLDYTSINEYRY